MWGVRDVIGGNNNHVLSYERTMSLGRSLDDAIKLTTWPKLWSVTPLETGRCLCRLTVIPDGWVTSPPAEPKASLSNEDLTNEAIRRVALHPNFKKPERIWRGNYFPHHGFRITSAFGPRRNLFSLGLGFFFDTNHTPVVKNFVKLPGRLAIEAFTWRQKGVDSNDPSSCVGGCQAPTKFGAFGMSLRYEQFTSNLFGFHTGFRFFHTNDNRGWATIGPMFQVPFRSKTMITVAPGAMIHPGSSLRYEVRISVDILRTGGAKDFGIKTR